MSKQTFKSTYNGVITLTQTEGESTLMINEFVQSGEAVNQIWESALTLLPSGFVAKSALILGFAGGSVVPLTRSHFPNIALTGVEIDPIMIELAQKYFPAHTNGVTLINQDAFTYLSQLPSTTHFDLILLDCYLHGADQPTPTQTVSFLADLKKHGQYILINQLLYPAGVDILKKTRYLPELKQEFDIKIVRLPYNVMIGY